MTVALYAILIYAANNPPSPLQARPSPYWGLFWGLYLVMFGSIWIDFLVVHFLPRPDARIQNL
jgi:hypothetical protein